ncbi:thiamine pyrophosphate-binding protein [Ruegeria marina]|uniref:Thiamine pyrophosphate enzyme, N-terminal TPP binding domain n=1 Tax=Ruegeria marina TaxID=639004 RepID=A0A1G6VFX2_9RHOB|nr:thiamine pyrophosphate-binding protein [Ruegeria marina]SDD52391.1 Thiamine pyrophosphate enzyme, N-terminal TPP binding domain [Ruegeria marina]
MAITDYSVSASAVAESLADKKINAVTTVPGLVQLALHVRLQGDPSITYLQCSEENQALTSATGMYVGGLEPVIMMRNQGVFNCINTLRSIGTDARIPLVILVGAFGREHDNLGQPVSDSRRVMVNRTQPVVEALGIPIHHIETADDLPKVGQTIDAARVCKCAAVVHFGHYLA